MKIKSVNIQSVPYAVFTNETELLKAKKIHIVCEAAEGEEQHGIEIHDRNTTDQTGNGYQLYKKG